jgi:hypothetical protein
MTSCNFEVTEVIISTPHVDKNKEVRNNEIIEVQTQFTRFMLYERYRINEKKNSKEKQQRKKASKKNEMKFENHYGHNRMCIYKYFALLSECSIIYN